MIEIRQTNEFSRWLGNLRDRQARIRIQVRIDRLALGNPGDVKPVGEGVSEMRIDYGPGYCVYFVRRGSCLCCWRVAINVRSRATLKRH